MSSFDIIQRLELCSSFLTSNEIDLDIAHGGDS
jgi:hypothetical protein